MNLSDGTHTEDGGGMFEYFPKDIWSNYKVDGRNPYRTDEHNNVLQVANCLLIKHPDGNILVETGMHDKTRSYVKHHNIIKKPSLIESMHAVGIKPLDIGIVNVIQKKEFQTAMNPGFELENDYFSAEKDVLPLEAFLS
ncbi:MBL fold metallo-hydrolase [Candidatus Methanoperedens nitratireducens]|uniref:Uncharacterized protein n=1 Tax=Candidatus Methanoperedens nitratireducens TaxID=1392998 RepID=A0A284VQQ8_9EURY|nr:hypothetical protein [Candidatus Methanoperedens nitroreducens]SNQ61507.1 hypothetical protein MNV_380007 [Candidatus Methanoperedens nitroreducens]